MTAHTWPIAPSKMNIWLADVHVIFIVKAFDNDCTMGLNNRHLQTSWINCSGTNYIRKSWIKVYNTHVFFLLCEHQKIFLASTYNGRPLQFEYPPVKDRFRTGGGAVEHGFDTKDRFRPRGWLLDKPIKKFACGELKK
jgi:hypothetical protein